VITVVPGAPTVPGGHWLSGQADVDLLPQQVSQPTADNITAPATHAACTNRFMTHPL
jgi:hypothetical protein